MRNVLRITAIQRLCVNDGPGVRTVVFLKGCSLHCPWCCNPEAISYSKNLFFDKGICGKYNEPFCKKCEIKGGDILKENCPLCAYEKTYRDYTVEELFAILMKDESLFRQGGGVTFSGGEPMLQAKSLFPLLQMLKKAQIDVAFETALYVPNEYFIMLLPYINYYLVDLKFQYGYIPNDDLCVDKNEIIKNLEGLQRNVDRKNILYRMVIMTECLSNLDNIIMNMKSYNIDSLQLLPYHELAKNKYKQLGLAFHSFTTPNANVISEFRQNFSKCGINVDALSL